MSRSSSTKERAFKTRQATKYDFFEMISLLRLDSSTQCNTNDKLSVVRRALSLFPLLFLIIVLSILGKLLLDREASALPILQPNSKELAKKNAKTKIKLDPTGLREWTTQADLPCKPPFRATYKKDHIMFTFLAVSHVSEPTLPSSPELALIESEIKAVHPSSVLIETVSGGVFPKEAIASIKSNCFQDELFTCGEAAYSAIAADRIGATVAGGEPVPSAIAPALSKHLDHESILAYESVKALLNLKRRGIAPSEWNQAFPSELRTKGLVVPAEWSYNHLKAWLANMGVAPEKVDGNWIEPINDALASPLQKIAHQVDLVREPLIVGAVEQLINRADTTMVIYGASHFYKQAPVLEKSLGQPVIACY